jgi:NAD(P)-dependent dehydrogenase (short-subunit alcohol dehydrogenase family)
MDHDLTAVPDPMSTPDFGGQVAIVTDCTDEDAVAALFLPSDRAGWITGVTLDVAGGKIMV